MWRSTRTILTVITALSSAGLAACGDDADNGNSNADTQGDTSSADDTVADSAPGEDAGQPPMALSTLAGVQTADTLTCGVNGVALGFGSEDNGVFSGFDVDLCRAVAAAVLGDETKVTFVTVSAADRFDALKRGDIDLLARNTTRTQSRDGSVGVDFGPTTFYDGQKLLGLTSVFGVDATIADINGTTICVPGSATSQLNITEAAAAAGVVATLDISSEFDDMLNKFGDGTCDLLTVDETALIGIAARLTADGKGPFTIFPKEPLSKEPLGPAYRPDDSQWADIVNWTVYAMVIADEKGITSANITTTWDVDAESAALFGGEGEGQTAMGLDADAFRRVIAQVGNYDEVFTSNLGPLGMARLGTPNARFGEGGLLFAPRAGGALPAELGPAPAPATSVLDQVTTRGELRCGMNGNLRGFGVLVDGNASGFDVDFCRAIAVAVLGDADAVHFEPLTGQQRFAALADGSIDVLIRNTTWTQSRDIRFDHGPPTYYDGQKLMGRAADGYSVDTTFSDIEGATICVPANSTSKENIEAAVAAAGVNVTLMVLDSFEEQLAAFKSGSCDIMTSDESGLVSMRPVFYDDGLADLVIFPRTPISKEPLGPVYRANDSAWADVVDWTVYAMLIADEKGVHAANVSATNNDPELQRLFGGEGEAQTGLGLDAQAFQRVITEVGSYNDVFRRNLEPLGLSRAGSYNASWIEGGLHYAPPAR